MESSILLKYFMFKQRKKFISPWDWTILLWLASVYNNDGHNNPTPSPHHSLTVQTVSFTVFLAMTREISNFLECDIMYRIFQ